MTPLFVFQFTALALPKIVAALVALATLVIVWRRLRRSLSAQWLLFLLAGVTVWSGAGALELSATLLEAKVFWNQVCYFGVFTGTFALINFIYVYVHGANMPRAVMLGVGALGAAVFISAATNRWHHWHWPAIHLIEREGVVSARYERGPMFWVTVFYGYGAVLACSAMMIVHAFTQAAVLRRQTWLVLAATLAPWLANLGYILRIGPRSEIDQTPLGFAVTGVLLSWAMLRDQLFDVVPVAGHTLLTRIPDPVLVVDAAGRLINANPAARRRLDLHDRDIARPMAEALASRPQLVVMFEELAARPRSETVEAGGVSWLAECTSLNPSGQRDQGHLFVLRDITELERTRQNLRDALEKADAANAAKTTFLAQVSHDLRTPLHAILGISDELLATPPAAIRRADLEIVQRAGGVLLVLINELLDLSSIEARRIELASAPFQLDDVLDELADLLGPVAHQKGVGFVHWIGPGLAGGLRGDVHRLRQILFNLAGNAVKFTDRGVVIVRAAPAGSSLRIEIEDTGAGIPAGHLESIFEPFSRGAPETARRTEGTGLGLAITRRLVGVMGGSIAVRSTPGRGTVFTVELPIVDDAATDPRTRELAGRLHGRRVVVAVGDDAVRAAVINGLAGLGAAVEPAASASVPGGTGDVLVVDAAGAEGGIAAGWREQGRAVLVLAEPGVRSAGLPVRRRKLAAAVLGWSAPDEALPAEEQAPVIRRWRTLLADDNELSRRVSEALLIRCGCDVDAVNGGVSALAKLRTQPYDRIVLDGQMPDLDGWEVVRRLRGQPAGSPNANTPVIAFTADLTGEARRCWIEAGANVVLGKPAGTKELREALERVGVSL